MKLLLLPRPDSRRSLICYTDQKVKAHLTEIANVANIGALRSLFRQQSNLEEKEKTHVFIRRLRTREQTVQANHGLTRANDVTTRWPDDDEFEKGWLEKMVYVKSRPDRAVMLLRAIDAQMSTTKTEQIVLPEDLTVEHLLPQKGAISDYPYPEATEGAEAEAPDDRRSRIIHTMGNLTLLTGPLNSSVSNGPFSDKRPAIAEHSALRLNARFQARQNSTWSELDIAARGRDLFAFAQAIWPRPGNTT